MVGCGIGNDSLNERYFLQVKFANFALLAYRHNKEGVMSENVAVVRGLFAALERGDLPGAIQFVGEEVDWQSPVTRTHPPEIPWSRIRRNKRTP